MKKLILVAAVLGLTQSVHAAPACAPQTFDNLKNAILNQNKIATVPIAAGQVYVGQSDAQSAANVTAGIAESQLLNNIWNRFGVTTKAFIESDGNIQIAAAKMIGAANRRQAISVYKRADSNSASSINANCGSGSCNNIALEVMALHLVNGKSAAQVMNILSAEKLSTAGSAKVYYCEAGPGCSRQAELGKGVGKSRQTKYQESMKLNIPYTVREVASSIAGTIDNTSVYEVQSFDICGHQAFLMTGVGTRDTNSFANSSSDVLVVEANGQIMSIALAQGVAVKGSSVQSIFLSSFIGGMARGTVVDGYNIESQLLGTREKVDKNGMLK